VDLLDFQRDEINSYHTYMKISERLSGENRELIRKIAEDELRHYEIIRRFTGRDIKPDRVKIFLYYALSRILGLTFVVKLMERSEERAQEGYEELLGISQEFKGIIDDELEHEEKLASMIKEERVEYIGSMILGLSDALVELTGSLAGFSIALQSSKYIAAAGLITGIAASLSMSASEYLSRKSELRGNPLRGAFYTGITYIAVVIFLVLPFLLMEDVFSALLSMLSSASLMVIFFSVYLAVIRERSIVRSALEMLSISLGVAALSYIIGIAARGILGLSID